MTTGRAIAVVAVDWGTTHLRLWPLDAQGQPVARHASAEGMNTLEPGQYGTVLERHLAKLGVAADTPVIVCGMAGARQGWMEAPYRQLPVALDDLASGSARFTLDHRAVAILPGAAKEDPASPDVMRSEETQLAGLVSRGVTGGLVCMPGTHTKWASLAGGKLTDFRTSMTGELFQLLETRSILRHSVTDDPIALDSDVFANAAREALAQPAQVVTQLFSLRAAGLMGHLPADMIRTRLSALLIGLDVAAALERSGPIASTVVVGGNTIGRAYCRVLEIAGVTPQETDGEELAIAGLAMAAHSLWPGQFSHGEGRATA